MAWTSGFFNSVSGDRTYNADHISKMFQGLITNGVYESVGNKLAVEPNGGMTVSINTGRGWFYDRWVYNDAKYVLTLEDADVLLNRYAAVCIKVDLTDSVRKAEPYIKYGEPGSTPSKPSMQRTETVQEFCLAYIYIGAGVTEITATAIEDTRFDSNLCGWVTGLITQLDTSTLYKQWEGVFLEWFQSLTDYLDEDVEAKLVADMIAVNNRLFKSTVTLNGLGWVSQSGGTYIQTVSVDGVSLFNHCMVLPDADSEIDYFDMRCEPVGVSTNSMTFQCLNPKDTDLKLDVIIYNL